MKKSLLAGLALGAALLGDTAFAQDPVSIVYIPKNTGNPYFDSLAGGFQDACKKLGCEFDTAAPATAEATSQIPFITAQTQRGVNVIAISPNSPDALNQVLDRARERGIAGARGQRRPRRQLRATATRRSCRSTSPRPARARSSCSAR